MYNAPQLQVLGNHLLGDPHLLQLYTELRGARPCTAMHEHVGLRGRGVP